MIAPGLRRYNRYDNHRSIEKFFRRRLAKHEKWGEQKRGEQSRFFPALMLKEGVEDDYIAYMQQKTYAVDASYNPQHALLQPGTMVRYIVRPEDRTFGKAGKGTLSQPVRLVGLHHYDRPTDKRTRQGVRTERTMAASYELEGTTQRFLPYELVVRK